MKYIDKNQLSLFPDEQENNHLTSDKDINSKRNSLIYGCLRTFLDFEASNYVRNKILQAIKDVPENKKDNNEDIDDIFNEWKYRFYFSEYDIMDAIPYLPNEVLRDIGEELQDEIDEYDEYLQSENEYFNEEFFEDKEDI